MSKDKRKGKSSRAKKEAEKIGEFTERLFGSVDAMSEEEVDALYSESGAGDPEDAVYKIASEIAQRMRLQNEIPPPHLRAAVEATRPLKDFGRVTPSRLQKIVDMMIIPNLGPAFELRFSFRSKAGLTLKDKAILEEASQEVQQDWSEE